MLEESSFPDRILEAGLQPISRPNVNFARSGSPLPIITTEDQDFRMHGLGRRQVRIGDLEIDPSPLITHSLTPTSPASINWWPYPPWGQSTLLSPAEPAAVPSSPAAAAAVVSSSNAPTSLPSTSAATLSPMADTPTVPSTPAIPPVNTSPSNPAVHTASTSHSKYLIPVLLFIGLALGAISCFLGYRWYSRRLARKGGPSNDIRTRRHASSPSNLVSGPPYTLMSEDLESARLATPTTAGSPSKYTRHGAPHAARSLMLTIPRAGSRSHHSSTRSSPIPPSRVSTTRTATASHSHQMSERPTRARSRASTISPVYLPDDDDLLYEIIAPSVRTTRAATPTHVENPTHARSRASTVISPMSLSDDDNVPYESIRHTSIRRNILERLRRGISRGPSRRTMQTYLSAPSVYSGTHTDLSRAPSIIDIRSSSPPLVDPNTEWIPASGFEIVDEPISSRPPSVAGDLPEQPTSAWDDGAAIRQAVDTHPDERWLSWTRSWTSSPPTRMPDLFAAATAAAPPARSRSASPEKRDVVVGLPCSPSQLTSGTLHDSLTFSSPSATTLAVPHAAATTPTTTGSDRRVRPLSRGHARRQMTRDDSRASSIVVSEGHGTPAMRYAARKTAHSRVEDILARSYSLRDSEAVSPGGSLAFSVQTPSTALGSTVEEGEDVDSTTGIVQRLTVAEVY